jgi:hypothetical protein
MEAPVLLFRASNPGGSAAEREQKENLEFPNSGTRATWLGSCPHWTLLVQTLMKRKELTS